MSLRNFCPGQNDFRSATALASLLAFSSPAGADTTITPFDDFTSNALYASWATGTVESGLESYSITATGYGSNWKYLPLDGSGNSKVQLTVTLSGPPAADGKLGPIVTLKDADGTSYNFAWYGQTLGEHVLTRAVDAPTWVDAPGSVDGLDLATLTHLHLQLDPGGYGTSGPYSVEWQDLSLIGDAAVPIQITTQTFDPTTGEMSLTWTSTPGDTYSVLQSPELRASFLPLAIDIPAEGATTSTTVTLPAGSSGFVFVQRQ